MEQENKRIKLSNLNELDNLSWDEIYNIYGLDHIPYEEPPNVYTYSPLTTYLVDGLKIVDKIDSSDNLYIGILTKDFGGISAGKLIFITALTMDTYKIEYIEENVCQNILHLLEEHCYNINLLPILGYTKNYKLFSMSVINI